MFIAPEKREVFPSRESSEATPTKLSQAIRIGASKTPWCKGSYYHNGATCAFGAAAVGFGASGEKEIYARAGDLHSNLTSDAGGAFIRAHGYNDIASMNDKGMTREKIADWLESQGY
jgi:hypothetical protein